MEVLVIGNTSGVGELCYNRFGLNNNVTGVNRTTHDLENDEDVYKVIALAEKSDLVLNIAKVQPAQNLILLKTYERWKLNNHNGHIISIGSIATNFDRNNFNEWIDSDMVSYLAYKKELEQIHNSIANNQPFGDQPKSTLIKPLNIGQKPIPRDDEPYCTKYEILDLIEYVVDHPCWLSTIEVRKLW
jgi:NADP-dependent 3-hydroxy acid dehydrogenase YdfG